MVKIDEIKPKVQYQDVINYRIRTDTKRERAIQKLCKLYGIEPGCRLIDRMLEDSLSIAVERKRKEAEIVELEQRAAEERKKLYGGQ